MDELKSVWAQLPNKWLFLVLLGAWLVMFHLTGNSTFGYYDTPSLLGWLYKTYDQPGSEDQHGLLIPFAVVVLLWWKREELLPLPARVWWPGVALLAACLGLHMIGFLWQQPRISAVAMFGGIYGLIGLAAGPAWMKVTFFPMVLLGFCVPVASLLLDVSFPLRVFATKIAVGLCSDVLGMSVARDGTRILETTGRYRYEVDAACSGIRSLIAICAFGFIYAFVSFKSPWRRLALIAVSFPMAVLGNVLRLMSIIIAAQWKGQEAGNFVHDNGTISLLFYIPAFLGLMVAGWVLREPVTRALGPGPELKPA